MRYAMTMLLLGTLICSMIGCETGGSALQSKGRTEPIAQVPADAPAPEPTARSAPTAPPPMPTADKPDFQGHHLNVALDGQATTPVVSGQVEQIWRVADPIAATPTVRFTFEETALGPMKKASIIINPIVDGEVQQANLWQYAGRSPLEPGQSIALGVFHHIADGKIDQNVKGLPPGEYRISVQVNGQATWDRQHIRVTVE
jgi:hypothetical protein